MALRRELARIEPAWHNAPVDPWGSPRARLLIVGLAPGRRGANRTGKPFVGDASGRFLFAALERCGFARRGHPVGVRITNAVACLPPDNRPDAMELANCATWLAADLDRHLGVRRRAHVLALGRVAHTGVLTALGMRVRDAPFAHGACHPLGGGRVLLDSYHPSLQNVNTGRLHAGMLDAVLQTARGLIEAADRQAG